MEEKSKKKGNGLLWSIILIVIIAGAAFWWFDLIPTSRNSNAYQAVFLTNNQVYFGKLYKNNSQFPVLKDVYYLQITQALQPLDEDAQPVTNVNLIKLGGEIHGPIDEMIINRDHILFFEDLKDDSQVVASIKQFK